MKKAFFYDTTLRDGMQGENIFFSTEDKIKIAKRLDDAGIHYIEGGWPGSNPGAEHFFEEIHHIQLKNAKIAAFGSTRRPDKTCDQDANIKALIKSRAPVVTIFGKSWDLHVEAIMQNTKEENLAMIQDSVSYLISHGREVIYDAEHFFDGYKANPDYATLTLEAAVKGGAKCLVLCDTNGGSMPCEIETFTRAMVDRFKSHPDVIFGIHTHNDCAMAVANSITAVHAGAAMVQGTINGYGERCGNADLTVIMEKLTDQFTPRFELESFRVVVEKDKERPCYSHAMIKIRVGNTTEITSAEGDGPVSALDNALRKALTTIYPEINTMHLVDFKVRVIDGMDGTAAKVRVLIESRDENGIFSTIGVSEDINEASWQALADSFQYKLSLDNPDKVISL